MSNTTKPKNLLIHYRIEGDDREWRVVVPRTSTGELAGQPWIEARTKNGDGELVWCGGMGHLLGTDCVLARALLVATIGVADMDCSLNFGLGEIPAAY